MIDSPEMHGDPPLANWSAGSSLAEAIKHRQGSGPQYPAYHVHHAGYARHGDNEALLEDRSKLVSIFIASVAS